MSPPLVLLELTITSIFSPKKFMGMKSILCWILDLNYNVTMILKGVYRVNNVYYKEKNRIFRLLLRAK